MTAWTALRTAPPPCPACGAPWKLTEILGAARRGGGYRMRCLACDHQWDEPLASHEGRHRARSAAKRRLDTWEQRRPPTTWVDVLTEHPQI